MVKMRFLFGVLLLLASLAAQAQRDPAVIMQELQKLAPDYIKKLVADANMQILDEKLKLPEEPTAQPSPQNAPATSR